MRQAQPAAVMAGEKLCRARASRRLEPKQLLQINVHACDDKHGGTAGMGCARRSLPLRWPSMGEAVVGVRQAQPPGVTSRNSSHKTMCEQSISNK